MVALVLVGALVAGVSADMAGPDEVVLEYLRSAFAPPDPPLRFPDRAYCRAWALLSRPSQHGVPASEFVAAARHWKLMLVDVELGDPRIDGDRATVRARYVVRPWVEDRRLVNTDFAHLVRDAGVWRMVLSDDGAANLRDAARQYARALFSRPVPADVCNR